MVLLVVPVVIVGATTALGGAAGDVVGCGVAGDVDGDPVAGNKGGTVMLAVTGVGAVGDVECGSSTGVAPGGWWCVWRRHRECCQGGGVLLVMLWVAVPLVRGWWGGEGRSAVGHDVGFFGVGCQREVGVVGGVVVGVCGQCRVS